MDNHHPPPDLLSHLDGVTGPDNQGWYSAICPFHDDHNPSLRLNTNGFVCMACGEKGGLTKLADKLGGEALQNRGNQSTTGLTVKSLAEAKGLPEEFLRSWGVKDGFTGSGPSRQPSVDIPYVATSDEVVAIHKRLSLHGSPRFVWHRGDKTTLYGLSRLPEMKKAGRVILVEGESDVWTLWYHGFPALGLPGSSTWREGYATVVQGLEVFVWHDPDDGGDALIKAVAGDLPYVRVIATPSGVKDISDLYLLEPAGFKERFESLMQGARPMSQLREEALGAEARECLSVARPLLQDSHVMQHLKELIAQLGYAGDPRPAMITFVGIVSRLLDRPLNVAYVSPSAAGKNAAVEVTLPMFGTTAYYLIRASSPRALVYNDEQFQHRTVILTEADSLPEDGPAASAIRSLMSDGEMSYEVVEKGDDGQFHVRKIIKPGPTGLITTSTKPLGDQASTRTLAVSIPDTPEQTRLVLRAQADRANQTSAGPDLTPWQALHRWLELAGDREVAVPFAHVLADLVPATAVRMRRDFPQLLTVVQVMALVHQRLRERDHQGRIVATLEDYAEARWLLEEVFEATVNEGLTPAVRHTVEAVFNLSRSGSPVTEQQLTAALGLSKSAVSYRVHRGLKGGWLVNQNTQRGTPAQLVLGNPMPHGSPLPTLDELRVRVDYPSIRSEGSNSYFPAPTEQLGRNRSNRDLNGCRTGPEEGGPFERGLEECSNGPSAREQLGPFDAFESFPEGSTHTNDKIASDQGALPWDSFLDEEEGDGPDSG